MFQMFNWMCLICICFLVIEIMVYFCKDAINLYNGVNVKKYKNVGKRRLEGATYEYQNKIAK